MNEHLLNSGPSQKRRILVVGLPKELSSWLEKRLAEVEVSAGELTSATLEELRAGHYSALVIDCGSTKESVAVVSSSIRAASIVTGLPILFCLGQTVGAQIAQDLVGAFAVAQLLFHPVDREEMARQVGLMLGIPVLPAHDPSDDPPDDLAVALQAIWNEFREGMIGGLDVLDSAISALEAGRLTEDLRRTAVFEAHKLAGTVGTGGLTEGSRQARELEHLLLRGASLSQTERLRLGQLTRSLRQELGRRPSSAIEASVVVEEALSNRTPRVLIVDDDRLLCEQLAVEAATRGMSMEIATEFATARQIITRQRPDVVLLDLLFPDGMAESMGFLAEMAHRDPPIPVLVLTGRDTFTDRVDVARLGGSGFLQKPTQPAQVLEAVSQVLQRISASEAKVLTVDDDPQVLATLRTLLASRQVQVTTLSDPLRFWETLEEVSPDLLVLDVDMPHLSGIELCRVVRNDPRWATLPVLFLTAHTDPEMIHRIFAAGADDYVTKPIVGPELVTRIKNRLDRTQLHRSVAETDALTGLANRRKATLLVGQYFRQAARNHEHLCLAVVDIDGFKQVNDTYGHLAGDTVLSRLGQLLTHAFRNDDVVARWGGEEFFVAMFGATRDVGIHRLADVLETVRQQEFGGDGGITFKVTFSGGVAAFPEDGGTLQHLFRAADSALYEAKRRGRNRLASAHRLSDNEGQMPPLDVLVVDDDAAFAEPLIRALETRAYETRLVGTIEEALAALRTLPPASRGPVILIHGQPTVFDELVSLHEHGDLRPCRAILVLNSSVDPVSISPTQTGSIRRIAKPYTMPIVMQHVRRALEN